MKYLFIGGHANGRWINAPESQSVVRMPFALDGGGFANENYQSMRMSEPDGETITVYVHDGTTKPLRKLLDGYMGGRGSRQKVLE